MADDLQQQTGPQTEGLPVIDSPDSLPASTTQMPGILLDPMKRTDPCSRLPLDVWTIIVDLCVEEYPEVGITLSAVSRSWRTSLVNMPAAWSYLRLVRRGQSARETAVAQLGKATTWIERSRGHIRRLTLDIGDARFYDEDLVRYAELLGPIGENVEHLDIKGEELYHITETLEGRFRKLQSLTIVHPYPDSSPTAWSINAHLCCWLLHPQCTSLRRLHVSRLPLFLLDLVPAQTGKLEELTLLDGDWVHYVEEGRHEPPARSSSSLHKLLSGAPELRKCDVDNYVDLLYRYCLQEDALTKTLPRVSLPKLTSWGQRAYETASPLTECQLPSLSDLTLAEADSSIVAALSTGRLHGVPFDLVRKLTFSTYYDADGLIELLDGMASLQHLVCVAPPEDILAALCHLAAVPQRWTQLCALEIRTDQRGSYAVIREVYTTVRTLVETRQQFQRIHDESANDCIASMVCFVSWTALATP